MGLRRYFANWLIKAAAATYGSAEITQWIEGRPYYGGVSQSELINRYTGWVYACVNRNAIACAEQPLRLYVSKPARKSKTLWPTRALTTQQGRQLERGPSRIVAKQLRKADTVEEVTEHPLLDLIATVNKYMGEFDLLESVFAYLDLCGNAYWGKIYKPGSEFPTELWPLLPQYCHPVFTKSNYLEHYEYGVDPTNKQILQPDKLIHFKNFNPRSPFLGMGPLQAASVAADLSTGFDRHEAALMQNRGVPDAVISFPANAQLTPEEEKRIEAKFRAKYRGIGKAGKLGVLRGGAKIEQLSLTPKEMNFLLGRKATLNEIAAIFGVPMSKLTSEDVNRANAREGNYTYAKDTVLPRLRRVEQRLNEQLVADFDERLFLAFDNPVPEDKEFRLKERESNIKTGYTSINEERDIDGWEPAQWGDVPYMPINQVPVGSMPLPQAEPEKSKSVKGGRRRYPPLMHPTNFVNDDFVRALQDYFERQEKAVLRMFDEQAKGKTASPHTKLIPEDAVTAWVDMSKWNGTLEAVVLPYLQGSFSAAGRRAMRRFTDRPFASGSSRAAGVLERHKGQIRLVNGTTVKQLRGVVAEGIGAGETIPQVRKRVQGVFDDAGRYRAERIARTEVIWAFNAGANEGYIQSGVVTEKEWSSATDSRACEFCQSMNGRTVSVEHTFYNKGDSLALGEGDEARTLTFDYEDIGHPPLHANCRCSIVPVVREA